MTLQQNIPLYNFFILTTLTLLFTTLIAAVFSGNISAGWFFLLFFLAGFSFYLFRKASTVIFSKSHGELDDTKEKINLLTESIEKKKGISRGLPSEHQKAEFLFKASQDLINLVDAEDIFNFLTNTAADLFPQADNILFFDFNVEKDLLSLVKSLKRKDPVVKEKRGDGLDKWVLRHNRSLLVEDLTKDFRFDYSKVKAYTERGANSFIVSPLSVGHRLFGVARLEGKKPLSFSMEDSRLLRYICDLGAVVLERANLFQNAQDMAIKDSLTSLFIKDYFLERLEEELKRPKKSKGKLGVIMLDIDDFKKINDTYGHIVGDFALKKLAKILVSAARGPGNIVSRFGGEEFIFSFINCDTDSLRQKAEEIREKIEQAVLSFRRKKIIFTVSLGAAIYSGEGVMTAKELVAKADKMLYKAKKEGKNKVCICG